MTPSTSPAADNNKAVITCALTGVLTNPKQHPVPVTPPRWPPKPAAAYDAGAAIVHVHFRSQEPGLGHLPTWDPDVAAEIATRSAPPAPASSSICPPASWAPTSAAPPPACAASAPRSPPATPAPSTISRPAPTAAGPGPRCVFDNPVDKVQAFLDLMKSSGTQPEFECFDLGIVRSVGLYVDVGLAPPRPHYNFVMGVASGMPTDPELLPFLLRYIKPGAAWEVTAIGREEIWPLHQRAADLGGCLRTGLEDTFYLPDGTKATSNGQLVAALAACARRAGRAIASPAEARALMHLSPDLTRARPPGHKNSHSDTPDLMTSQSLTADDRDALRALLRRFVDQEIAPNIDAVGAPGRLTAPALRPRRRARPARPRLPRAVRRHPRRSPRHPHRRRGARPRRRRRPHRRPAQPRHRRPADRQLRQRRPQGPRPPADPRRPQDLRPRRHRARRRLGRRQPAHHRPPRRRPLHRRRLQGLHHLGRPGRLHHHRRTHRRARPRRDLTPPHRS
jgi:3-keto-5-aminohexanoate cleavage enzyme